jgi:plastocyanin
MRFTAWLLGIVLLSAGAQAIAAPDGVVHTVVIEAMRFSPSHLEVNVGDTVIWKNQDPFPHTATSEKNGFDSKTIPASRTWKFVAKKPGTFPYLCTLHETMKGTLVVK